MVNLVLDTNNLILQKATFTCGPVSLLNVLRLQGNSKYDEESLAELCDARPGVGTDNAVLVKVAESIGLKVLEAKAGGTIEAVEKYLDGGNYVIVNYLDAFSGDGHYAVITHYDAEALYFADSNLGLLRLARGEFKKWWHNSDKSIYGWYMVIGS